MNRKNKVTFYSTIVLLLIFLPLAIIGTYNHFKDPNEKHELHFNGNLYFYNSEDKLIGIYECINETCDYAPAAILDQKKDKKTSLINNKYAYIKDGKTIYLQDIEAGETVQKFRYIATYSNLFDSNIFLVKKNDLVGVIRTSPNPTYIQNRIFDDIYLLSDSNGKYMLANMVVYSEGQYQLLKDNKPFFKSYDRIEYFNDKYVIVKTDDDKYLVLDYDENDMFETQIIDEYQIIDDYLVISVNNWTYKLILKYNDDIKNFDQVLSYDGYVTIEKKDDAIVILDGENIVNQINLVEK